MNEETVKVIVGIIAVFVVLPLIVIPYWKIFGRAGFPRWFGILMLLPLINFLVLYLVAFGRWKTDPPRPLFGDSRDERF